MCIAVLAIRGGKRYVGLMWSIFPDAIHKWAWFKALPQIFQSLFYIVVATVTVLTFIHAKRAILQPLRTEIFKLQLAELSKVLELVVGKGEVQLREDFDIPNIFQVNCVSLYDSYAAAHFPVKIEPERRPYMNREGFPTGKIKKSAITVADDYVKPGTDCEPDRAPERSKWEDFECSVVFLLKKYEETKQRWEELLGSPLLQTMCAELIEAYLRDAEQYIDGIFVLLTDAAQELPEKYPNFDQMRNGTMNWLVNRFNSDVPSLESRAKEIVVFIRQYYSADELLEIGARDRRWWRLTGEDGRRRRPPAGRP